MPQKSFRKSTLLFVFFLFLLSNDNIFCKENDYSIVFFYKAKAIPDYIIDAIAHARSFNENCDIYFITSKEAVTQKIQQIYAPYNINFIFCENLQITDDHKLFLKNSVAWDYLIPAAERFFYIYEFMNQYKIQQDVFQIECDNLLYNNLSTILPILHKYYPGIAATFDSDFRCVPGFMYISNIITLDKMLGFFVDHAKDSGYEMHIIGTLKNESAPDLIDSLPILCKEYFNDYTKDELVYDDLARFHKKIPASYNTVFINHSEDFQLIFDAAALGGYLAGGPKTSWCDYSEPGYINKACCFDPSKCSYEWILDEQGRKIPYMICKNKKYKINNLHVHSKRTERVLSFPIDHNLLSTSDDFTIEKTSLQISTTLTLNKPPLVHSVKIPAQQQKKINRSKAKKRFL